MGIASICFLTKLHLPFLCIEEVYVGTLSLYLYLQLALASIVFLLWFQLLVFLACLE